GESFAKQLESPRARHALGEKGDFAEFGNVRPARGENAPGSEGNSPRQEQDPPVTGNDISQGAKHETSQQVRPSSLMVDCQAGKPDLLCHSTWYWKFPSGVVVTWARWAAYRDRQTPS